MRTASGQDLTTGRGSATPLDRRRGGQVALRDRGHLSLKITAIARGTGVSRGFWQRLERSMPDYRTRKDWLIEHGREF